MLLLTLAAVNLLSTESAALSCTQVHIDLTGAEQPDVMEPTSSSLPGLLGDSALTPICPALTSLKAAGNAIAKPNRNIDGACDL